jgi:hypothetical protein
MIGNGRRAERLSTANPFDLLCTPPNCHFVTDREFEIVLLYFAVRIRVCRCVQYGHTVFVIVLIGFVSEIGGGHSDQNISPLSSNQFNFVTVPAFNFFTGENGLPITFPNSDSDNAIVDDGCVAVGCVDCGSCLFPEDLRAAHP